MYHLTCLYYQNKYYIYYIFLNIIILFIKHKNYFKINIKYLNYNYKSKLSNLLNFHNTNHRYLIPISPI